MTLYRRLSEMKSCIPPYKCFESNAVCTGISAPEEEQDCNSWVIDS